MWIEWLYNTAQTEVIGVTLHSAPSVEKTVYWDDIPGNGWPPVRLDRLRDKINADYLTTRTPLSSFPPEDDLGSVDPAQPYLYHDGSDLVQVHYVCKDIQYNGGQWTAEIEHAYNGDVT